MDVEHVIEMGRRLKETLHNVGIWVEEAVAEIGDQGTETSDIESRWQELAAQLSRELVHLESLRTTPDEAMSAQPALARTLSQLVPSIRELALALAPAEVDTISDPVDSARHCLTSLATEVDDLVAVLQSTHLVSLHHWADVLADQVDKLSADFMAALPVAWSAHKAVARFIADLQVERSQRQRLHSIEAQLHAVTTDMADIGSSPMNRRTRKAARVADQMAEAAATCQRIGNQSEAFLGDFHWEFRVQHRDGPLALVRFADESMKPLWEFVRDRLPTNVALRDQRWPLDANDEAQMSG